MKLMTLSYKQHVNNKTLAKAQKAHDWLVNCNLLVLHAADVQCRELQWLRLDKYTQGACNCIIPGLPLHNISLLMDKAAGCAHKQP